MNRNNTNEINIDTDDLKELEITGMNLFIHHKSDLLYTDSKHKTENLFMKTGEMDRDAQKKNERLENSLKKHVKQYEPNIFRREEEEYVPRDRDLITKSVYHSHKPTHNIEMYYNKPRVSQNESRRFVKTAAGFSRERTKHKNIRIHTSSGARTKPQFNGVQSEILQDKRCKTAAFNTRQRIKSDFMGTNQEPSLNIMTDYNINPNHVSLKPILKR